MPDQLTLNHYFNENSDGRSIVYNIVLAVNPFERVPSGQLDPEDNPPRYPDISKGYHIFLLPAAGMAPKNTEGHSLVVGQLLLANGKITINNNYIPPSSSIVSHPALIRYYEQFSVLMNDLQLLLPLRSSTRRWEKRRSPYWERTSA